MSKPPLHQYQSFLDPRIPRGGSTAFVETTYDIASGLGLALELIHSSNVDRLAQEDNPNNSPPILGVVETERLMRFAIVASNLLAEAAWERIDSLNHIADEEAKA